MIGKKQKIDWITKTQLTNGDCAKSFARPAAIVGFTTALNLKIYDNITLDGQKCYLTLKEKFNLVSSSLATISLAIFLEYTLGQDDPNTKMRIAGGVLGLVGSLGISKYLPYPKS